MSYFIIERSMHLRDGDAMSMFYRSS